MVCAKLLLPVKTENEPCRCGNIAAIMTINTGVADPKFEIFNSVSDLKKIQNFRNAVPYFL